MRIIGGTHGGRRINPPHHMPHTRPTTDIAKEGLFNVIDNNLNLEEVVSLDLFGGTGCISYELASRGVPDLTVVEKDPSMYAFICKTKESLGFSNMQVIRADVFKFIEGSNKQYDFIFAGPPYALNTIDQLPEMVFKKKLLSPKGWFVLEHTPRNDYRQFQYFRTERKYGTTIFSIFIQD